jgi:hypothetical protein
LSEKPKVTLPKNETIPLNITISLNRIDILNLTNSTTDQTEIDCDKAPNKLFTITLPIIGLFFISVVLACVCKTRLKKRKTVLDDGAININDASGWSNSRDVSALDIPRPFSAEKMRV